MGISNTEPSLLSARADVTNTHGIIRSPKVSAKSAEYSAHGKKENNSPSISRLEPHQEKLRVNNFN